MYLQVYSNPGGICPGYRGEGRHQDCMIRVAGAAWPPLRDDIVRADPSQTAGDVNLPRCPHPATKLKLENDHK